MIIPIEALQTIEVYARAAGLIIDGDDETVARVKAIAKADEVKTGLLDAADYLAAPPSALSRSARKNISPSASVASRRFDSARSRCCASKRTTG